MPSPVTRLKERWQGLRRSLAFSNRWELLLVRGLYPRRRIVVYEWQGRFTLACDVRTLDHHSPKEALAEAAYDLIIQHSRREGRCSYVNIGANIGAFDVAVAALSEVPQALSVELNPRTYRRLCFNLQANDFHQVKVMNCGVAGQSGKHQFALTDCSLADSLWSSPDASAGGETVEMELKTLTQCLDESGFAAGEFDLLKLDCEGAEYGIVRETAPAVLRRFRHVVMELHPCPPGETAEALHAKLAEIGFESRKLEGSPAPAENLSYWQRVGEGS